MDGEPTTDGVRILPEQYDEEGLDEESIHTPGLNDHKPPTEIDEGIAGETSTRPRQHGPPDTAEELSGSSKRRRVTPLEKDEADEARLLRKRMWPTLSKDEQEKVKKLMRKAGHGNEATWPVTDLAITYLRIGKSPSLQRYCDALLGIQKKEDEGSDDDRDDQESRPPGRACNEWRTLSSIPACPAPVWHDYDQATAQSDLLLEHVFPEESKSKKMTVFLNGVPHFPEPKFPDEDWLCWVDRNDKLFGNLSCQELNYVLLLRAGRGATRATLDAAGRNVATMGMRDLVRTIGRAVYKFQNKNPLVIAAREIHLGKMGCTTLTKVFNRVADLNYCRYDQVRTEQFVLDIFKSFHAKFDDGGAERFINKTQLIYPTLFTDGCRYENSTVGVETPLQSGIAYPLTANMRPFPLDAAAIKQYVDTLVKLAGSSDSQDIGKKWRMSYLQEYGINGRLQPPDVIMDKTCTVPTPSTAANTPEIPNNSNQTTPNRSRNGNSGATSSNTPQRRRFRPYPPSRSYPRQELALVASTEVTPTPPRQTGNVKSQDATPTRPTHSQPTRLCFRCHSPSHFARDCPRQGEDQRDISSARSRPFRNRPQPRTHSAPSGNRDRRRNPPRTTVGENQTRSEDKNRARTTTGESNPVKQEVMAIDVPGSGNVTSKQSYVMAEYVPTEGDDPCYLWAIPYEKGDKFNCPSYEFLCNDTCISMLVDSGSTISILPSFCLSTLAMSKVFPLSCVVACTTATQDSGGRTGYGRKRGEVRPALINRFCMMHLKVWGLDVEFPFHVLDMPVPVVILGRDFLLELDISIHLTPAAIAFKYPKRFERDELAFWSHLSDKCNAAGRAYCNKLRWGNVSASDVYSTYTVTRGIAVGPEEFLLYPTRERFIPALTTAKMLIRLHGMMLRRNEIYCVMLRFPLLCYNGGDPALSPDIWTYTHQSGDSPYLDLAVYTTLDYDLDPKCPVGVIKKYNQEEIHAVGIEKSTDASVISDGARMKPFKLQQVFPDFPIPEYGQPLPDVPPYTDRDLVEARTRKAQLIGGSEGSYCLTPKPGVEIPVEIETEDDWDKYLLLSNMLSQLPDRIWSQEDPTALPGIDMSDVTIRVRLNSNTPVCRKFRRRTGKEMEVAITYLRQESQLGLFEPANSPWSCNITWAPKPDGSLRLCINYQPVNELTVKDEYNLPRLENIINNISGKRFFSLVDIRRGFNNLYIHPDDRHFLAFSSPIGQLQPVRLPFGWSNGPPAFQREMDNTLGPLGQHFMAYIDDISGGTSLHQRQHDLALGTLLANAARRGFLFHAAKAQLLRKSLRLVGVKVDGEGVHPSPSDGIFDSLLQRPIKKLKDIQRVLGTLLWFKQFVPNFTYVVKPLMKYLKADNRMGDEILITPDCLEAIKTVQCAVLAAPKLVHHKSGHRKNIYLVVGLEAFAILIKQVNEAGEDQPMEFWSKRWVHKVESYQKYEMYALATREIVKRFYAVLHDSGPIMLFSREPAFNAFANNPMAWTPKMVRYLSHTTSLPIKFCNPVDAQLRELDILDGPIVEDQPLVESCQGLIARLERYFRISDEVILRNIPQVHTDGGCLRSKVNGERKSSIGIYWGKDSPLNISRLACKPPFTNQRAELEAIGQAVEQAIKLKLEKLILASDSAYAVNNINEADINWRKEYDADGNLVQLIDSKGAELKNSDLFVHILSALKNPHCPSIYFMHVRREHNVEADSLASEAFIQKPTAEVICHFVTRSQALEQRRRMERERKVAPAWGSGVLSPQEIDEGWELQVELTDDEDYPSLNKAKEESSTFVEDPEESEVEEDFTKTESGPPLWTEDMVAVNSKRSDSHPVLRLNALHLSDLLEVMTILPAEQSSDPHLAPIIAVLRQEAQPETLGRKKEYSQYSLCPQTQCLIQRMEHGGQRFVLPRSLQRKVLELFHSSLVLGGHPGSRAMTVHIKRYFHWKGINSMVKSYCDSCEVCVTAKNQRGKIPGHLTPLAVSAGPFGRVHMDTIHGLPRSKNAKYILVVMCSFTKYIFTASLPSLHPRHVIEALTAIFTRFGQPSLLVADNGGEFHNKELMTFLLMWGVPWKFSSPYNPQANGQAEAGVKIISQRLRAVVLDLTQRTSQKTAAKHWPTLLPYVTMAYNCTPGEATGFAPYELVFGRMPALPLKPVPEMDVSTEDLPRAASDYLCDVKLALSDAIEIAQERLTKRSDEMCEQFDKFRRELHLKEGDWVYITYPYSKKLAKLEARAFGPYQIVGVTKNPKGDLVHVECQVQDGDISKKITKIFPRRRLRPISATTFLPQTRLERIGPAELEELASELPVREELVSFLN